MASIYHDIFNIYECESDAKIGDGSEDFYNGVKEEFSQTIVDLNIPSSVNGFKIVYLTYRCFSKMDNLKSVYIPNTIKIMIGDTFLKCSSLETIVFEEGSNPLDLGSFTFYAIKIPSIILPTRATSIGAKAFGYTNSIKTIVIKSFVNYNDENIFEGTDKTVLRRILVPSNYPYDTFGTLDVIKELPPYYGIPKCHSCNNKRIEFKTYFILIILFNY